MMYTIKKVLNTPKLFNKKNYNKITKISIFYQNIYQNRNQFLAKI